MLRSRWLSTFTIIGIVLIVLGITGLFMGSRFIYDPGQRQDGNDPWYYLVIGVLMVVNGIFTPSPAQEQQSSPQPSAKPKSGETVVAATERQPE